MTPSNLKDVQEYMFKQIGLRIRGLRMENSISVFQLAKFLRRSHNEIDEIEAGSGQLTLQNVLLLTSKFNVDFKWLCQELVEHKTAPQSLSLKEIEMQLAMELSKLKPGIVDRVMRLISPMRIERRAQGIKQPPSSIILKRVQELVSQPDMDEPLKLTSTEE